MRQTTRTGETPENNFVEATVGEMHPSVEVSVNSKGQYQYVLKLFFDSNDSMLEQATELVKRFDEQFRAQFPVPDAKEQGKR